MNRKGFTLVELLSVIAILGIIALITIPVVSSIVQHSKDKAYDVQVSIIIDGAKKWLEKNYDKVGSETTYLSINKLISSGIIEQDSIINPRTEEEMSGCVKISFTSLYNQYEYEYVESCSSYLVKYDNGYSVNFNPETGELCNEPISTTGTKTGCMKWYVFNDSIDELEVNMILDHNTSPLAKWITITDYVAAGGVSTDYGATGNTSLGPISLKSKLASDTSTWKQEFKPRNIKANEVAKITGKNWDVTTAGYSGYYLDGFTPSSSNQSSYWWLYDNLYDTISHGGRNQDNNSYQNRYYELETKSYFDMWNYQLGYWTEDKVYSGTGNAWAIINDGSINNAQVWIGSYYGIRPVITISKSLLNN